MPSSKRSSHFAELLDFLPGVVAWVKDRQGRYRWVNRAFLVQYSLDHPGGRSDGVTVESVLGKTDYDLSPAFLADQFRHDDEQVLAGHRIVNRLERVGESGGTTVWNITDKVPVVDAKGAIVGTGGITRAANPGRSLEATHGFGPALAHMRTHFHHEITNRDLASISNMSLRAFERRFRAAFHLTPQKFLRKLRLRIASRALMNTDESLSGIALKCGFADQSHFSREFRRHFGRTPREYREHYKL